METFNYILIFITMSIQMMYLEAINVFPRGKCQYISGFGDVCPALSEADCKGHTHCEWKPPPSIGDTYDATWWLINGHGFFTPRTPDVDLQPATGPLIFYSAHEVETDCAEVNYDTNRATQKILLELPELEGHPISESLAPVKAEYVHAFDSADPTKRKVANYAFYACNSCGARSGIFKVEAECKHMDGDPNNDICREKTIKRYPLPPEPEESTVATVGKTGAPVVQQPKRLEVLYLKNFIWNSQFYLKEGGGPIFLTVCRSKYVPTEHDTIQKVNPEVLKRQEQEHWRRRSSTSVERLKASKHKGSISFTPPSIGLQYAAKYTNGDLFFDDQDTRASDTYYGYMFLALDLMLVSILIATTFCVAIVGVIGSIYFCHIFAKKNGTTFLYGSSPINDNWDV